MRLLLRNGASVSVGCEVDGVKWNPIVAAVRERGSEGARERVFLMTSLVRVLFLATAFVKCCMVLLRSDCTPDSRLVTWA